MGTSSKILAATTAMALAPGISAAQDWSGFYAGATLGYSVSDATHTFDNGAPSGSSDPRGGMLGAFMGYGVQSGNMVYGGEIDLEYNAASGSYVNPTGATSAGSVDGIVQGSLRGVLGYAGQIGGDPALFYATAGFAAGRFDFMGGPAASPANTYTDTVTGWTAGIGMDWRIAMDTSFRIEYRYTDFGTASGRLNPAFPGVTMPVDMEQHALRVGVRMEF